MAKHYREKADNLIGAFGQYHEWLKCRAACAPTQRTYGSTVDENVVPLLDEGQELLTEIERRILKLEKLERKLKKDKVFQCQR